MSCYVLVKELAPVDFLDTAVYPELGLDVRKRALQRIVGVWYSKVRIVICRPQEGHVALEAEVCTPEWPVGEMSIPRRLRTPLCEKGFPPFVPLLQFADKRLFRA